MITANYFLDIISGVIKDITIGLETEEFLFEVFNNPEIVTADDIRYLKDYNIDIIYKGKSFRYENDSFCLSNLDASSPRQFYIWSKSSMGLKNFSPDDNYNYIMCSDIEGIDVFKISKYCLKLSRLIKKNGYISKLVEFNKLRNDSKLGKLVIAPIGNNTSLLPLSNYES